MDRNADGNKRDYTRSENTLLFQRFVSLKEAVTDGPIIGKRKRTSNDVAINRLDRPSVDIVYEILINLRFLFPSNN